MCIAEMSNPNPLPNGEIGSNLHHEKSDGSGW